MALPVFTYDQIAHQLTDVGQAHWQDIRQKFDVGAGGTITYNPYRLNSAGEEFVELAFQAWGLVTGITFERVYINGDITFTHSGSGLAYAETVVNSAGVISSATVTVSRDFYSDDWSRVADEVVVKPYSYGLTTFIHEIGHALGLAHGGNYNGYASYPNSAHYANDSWQASIMSYFSQQDNTSIDASYATPVTPMIADIIAIQNLYGTGFAANAGATIYGKGGNTGTYLDGVFQSDVAATFTLFDSAGVDTLDLTYATVAQTIDLNAEGISDVNGLKGNMVIARGTVIERALLGSGNDTVKGNAAGNLLSGGLGIDTLSGQSGDDVMMGDAFKGAYSGWSDDVFRLYQATLNRLPDVGGHTNWAALLENGSETLVSAASGFVGSVEFNNVYGALNNADFVTRLYQNVLGREGDATGQQNWQDALTAGTSRATVVVGFSQSAEFTNKTEVAASTFAYNSLSQNWTDDVFRLYQASLERRPDDVSLLSWTKQLADGRDYLDVASGFVNSAEFTARYGADLTNEGFVTQLYQNVLNRAPDAAGLQAWTDAMASSASRSDVLKGFAQSAEFIINTRSDLLSYMQSSDRLSGAGSLNGDKIDAGSGNDKMFGGEGIDSFVFRATEDGQNTIADFELWDILAFDAFGYSAGSDALAHMVQSGANVAFSDKGVNITLENVQLSEIGDGQLQLWTEAA